MSRYTSNSNWPLEPLFWTCVEGKDGEIITASSRVRIMEMYGTHSLVLSRTDHGDTGKYSITASNHVGSETCSAQLRVKDSPYSSSASTPRGRRSGYDSTDVHTPTYSSSGSPSTSNLSSPSMSPKLGRAANSRLVSGSVSSPWSTDAKSRSGSSGGSSPRRRAPGFILRPRPQTVACGDKFVLKCTLLGHPKPNVTWDHDGHKLDESANDRVRIWEDGSDFYLEISDTTSGDAGKYTVQAKNNLGRQSATVEVVIMGAGSSVKSRSNHDMSDKLNNNTSASHQTKSKIEITVHKETKPSSHSSFVSSFSRGSATSRSSASDDSASQRSRRTNQVAPTFTRRLSSTQILEGEDLELHCEIAGSPLPELTWTRNGTRISQREPNINIHYDEGVATLKLNHIKPSQAGEYLCMARNVLGETKCSSRVTVKPKPKQSKPKFIKPPKDMRIEEGETLSLEAEVTGLPEPEVLWSLDGEEISHGECTYRNNIARLVLRDVSFASSGQYMCTAINDAGEDSAACRVRIKQKKLDIAPEFTAPLSDVKTTEGENISLRCMVTCIPEPRLQWMFNDEVLESGGGIEMSYHDGVAALTLEQATVEDTGCYSCIAVNREGQSSTSCQVVVSEVQEKEQPIAEKAPEFVSKFEEYVRAMEGDTVTLECQVKGTPEPEVAWTIDRKPVRSANVSYENGRAVLVIESVTTDHGGNVVFTAKNSQGQIKHDGRLYVRAKREAPSFVSKLPGTVEVQEGKEVTFGCQIKGHPQPRVSWTRNGRNLSVLNTETSYEEGKASVRIRKAGTSDGGRYVCTARNLSGETESVCQVTVAQKKVGHKPDFVKPLSDLSLEDGQDIRLECKVTGDPQPQITWILDGQKLEAEDGDASFKDGVARMVLEDAMSEDSGVYECIARNEEGEAKTSCKVVVSAKKPAEDGPSFPVQLEDMTINENDDIVLKCQVKGNPRPTITWLLDGEPIPDAECKYSEDGNAELFLPEALPEDEGVYTCIAQNKLNRVMCSCKVTVKALPRVSKKKQASSSETVVKKETVMKVDIKKTSAKPTRQEDEPKSNKSTPTSSSTRLNGEKEHVKSHHKEESSDEEPVEKREGPDRPPKFVSKLQDKVVPDGSINYKLTARVAGLPPPLVKWYINDEEIEDSDDFRYETDGDQRRLIFAEIFPEDSGTYTCVAMNSVGEDKTQMKLSVEEIDGDPPNFITKPRPLTVNAGESAVFTCKVDGEPVPTVQWLYCNQPIIPDDHIIISTPTSENNYVHTLEVCETRMKDAGRYAACCSNLLGDVTCTVSLIVDAVKNQEERKDFRDVLKKATPAKTGKSTEQAEQLDFRGVLKRTESATSPEPSPAKGDEAPDFREVLSRPVRTKVLSEEERKALRAEQKDFRGTLVRKVDTKTVSNDLIKTKAPEQKDFRDEALKTRVKTKAYAEDVIKQKPAEQKDFRSEALKTRVVTKAYKEENIKTKRAEQVDFRDVLSPTNKRTVSKEDAPPSESSKGFELPATPAKLKINKDKMDHNTVATRRTRARPGAETSRKAKTTEQETKEKTPEFTRKLKDTEVKDSDPFELECRVSAFPPPTISWFLGEEEIHAEADISITQEGDVCKLHVAESFPDDEGTYTCRAENEHGVIKCSAHVTVVTGGELECEQDA